MSDPVSRRKFLLGATASGFIATPAFSFNTGITQTLPAGEDLMQEHGVLRRLLLIFDELAGRFERGESDPDNSLPKSVNMIVEYMQGHHERIEELIVFPALTKAGVLADVIDTLVVQHKSGHEVTTLLTTSTSMTRPETAKLLRSFTQMFRVHTAREDTVVFPTLRRIMSPGSYANLSEKIRHLEAKMKPADLNQIVGQITAIEQQLGIHNLAQFTVQTSQFSSETDNAGDRPPRP